MHGQAELRLKYRSGWVGMGEINGSLKKGREQEVDHVEGFDER